MISSELARAVWRLPLSSSSPSSNRPQNRRLPNRRSWSGA
jgi:hypothetical protein